MITQDALKHKIESEFKPLYLEVHNESHMHNVPQGSESHFRVVIVSDRFSGLDRVDRQRLVSDTLKPELQRVHAFSQRLMTPEEWNKVKDSFKMQSPECAQKRH